MREETSQIVHGLFDESEQTPGGIDGAGRMG